MSCCPPATLLNEQRRRAGMRVIGLDIHRAFAEAVALDDGKLKRLGRVDMRRHLLEAFAKKLSKEDVVVIEATGNAASVAAVIAPHVKRIVIANPKQVRIIAHARIKTDTIDAGVLAQLCASGFLPEVWDRRRADAGAAPAGHPSQSDRAACGLGLNMSGIRFSTYITILLMELGIKYQVQRLMKSVDAPCFSSAEAL